MNKNLKVLLLSGVTLLMVACTNQTDDTAQITVSSNAVKSEVVSEDISSESLETEDTEVSEEESDLEEETESSESDVAETDKYDEEKTESSEDDAEVESASSEADSSADSDEAETDSDVADDSEDEADTEDAEVRLAPVVVKMLNQAGDEMGTATFEEAANGVILTLKLEGLEAGEYGFHMHEYGKATPPTFMDALGHFNPTDNQHGIHSEGGPHIGDFPNLIVGKDGKVDIIFVVSNVSLTPGAPYTLRTENGTSLIIHEGPDDYETQPIGTAGYGMIGGVIFAPQNDEASSEESSSQNSSDKESDEAKKDEDSSEEASNESKEESDSSSSSSSSKEETSSESKSED